MRAIILAAGESKRLKELTMQTPKCLLDVSGKSILGRQLHNLKECGVKNVTIVTGFCGGMITEFVKDYEGMDIKLIHNGIWNETNNGYSLALALEQDDSPFVLLNADTVFLPDMLKKVVEHELENVMAIAHKSTIIDEDMKVLVNGTVVKGTHKINGISKDPNYHDDYGSFEFTGVAKFGSGIELMKPLLKENKNDWFEKTLQDLLLVDKIDLYGLRIFEPYIEIDFPKDLAEARDKFIWGWPDWEQGNRHASIETGYRSLDDAKKLLCDMVEMLELHNIKYWLNWGLLLGAVRDGQPIPWDTDMDVTIHKEDEQKLIDQVIPAMQRLDCFVVDPKKCYEGDFWFIRDGEKIELNTVQKLSDRYSYSPGRCDLDCPHHYLDTLDEVEMFGRKFKIPSNVDKYLALSYGEDWKTPIKGKKPKSVSSGKELDKGY